jgi:hypothetical protein
VSAARHVEETYAGTLQFGSVELSAFYTIAAGKEFTTVQAVEHGEVFAESFLDPAHRFDCESNPVLCRPLPTYRRDR